jgi:hypothetical protein
MAVKQTPLLAAAAAAALLTRVDQLLAEEEAAVRLELIQQVRQAAPAVGTLPLQAGAPAALKT